MKSTEQLLALADQCVKCGMCSATCPTYQLTHRETESPRGRIALIQALLGGQIDLDSPTRDHLKNCLLCRTCERVCPSKVNFGQLMDSIREHYVEQFTPQSQNLIDAISEPKRLAQLGGLARLYQMSGIQKLTRGLGLLGNTKLKKLDALLPNQINNKPLRSSYEPISSTVGKVALFTGCLSNQFERDTLDASLTLLTKLGYAVEIPTNQGCCGAMHQHLGQTPKASALAKQNIETFAEHNTILFTSSGCGSRLKEYGQNSEFLEENSPFSQRTMEIGEFLLKESTIRDLPFKPLQQSVAIHQPCSQTNSLRQGNIAHDLLSLIPGLTITTLANPHSCCGAAGSYMLEDNPISTQLRDATLATIPESTDRLVTTNIGCKLHLASGIKNAGRTIPVLHPLALLVQQLD